MYWGIKEDILGNRELAISNYERTYDGMKFNSFLFAGNYFLEKMYGSLAYKNFLVAFERDSLSRTKENIENLQSSIFHGVKNGDFNEMEIENIKLDLKNLGVQIDLFSMIQDVYLNILLKEYKADNDLQRFFAALEKTKLSDYNPDPVSPSIFQKIKAHPKFKILFHTHSHH